MKREAVGAFDHLPQLDFQVVREKIDTLIAATQNKLEREWPAHLAEHQNAAVFLRGMVAISGNTYHSILFLVADRPPASGRRPEYVASVPPLARTILDSLFNLAFLLDDLPR